jgi:N-acetylmuramoyl-L-alanine amidase
VSLSALTRPSPNWNERPTGAIVTCLVLHADASAKLSSSLHWILSKESKVSYHDLVGRAGHIYECVQPSRRAWHAGISEYQGVPDVNDFSIGVCFSNDQKGEPFSDRALEHGAKLCANLILRHPGLTIERITTHAEIARPKGRKTDPGSLFPFGWFLERVRFHLD